MRIPQTLNKIYMANGVHYIVFDILNKFNRIIHCCRKVDENIFIKKKKKMHHSLKSVKAQ